MNKKPQILLVEDNTSMGFLLVDFLESNGFEVMLCNNGDTGWSAYKNKYYDFCILDIMLPGKDGFSIAELIRKENKDIPIIFLTARSMKQDKIKGFELGVDDYITKPFDEDELLCRIKAVINRYEKSNQHKPENQIFELGRYSFDQTNQLLIIEKVSKRLTTKESLVLGILSQNKNRIVKRDDILIAIWGDNNYFNGRSLDVYITKLRKYLNKDKNINIENIPKVGYVLNIQAN